MENIFERSIFDGNDDTRRVNNAVFISKNHEVSEESDAEEYDTRSVSSRMTEQTVKAWEGFTLNDYDSDSSTSTAVIKIGPRRKEHDPDAFNKWLKAKTEADRKRKEQERRRKHLEDTRRRLEEEQRKQESEEKFKQWTERKEQELKQKKAQEEKAKSRESKQSQSRKGRKLTEQSTSVFQAWTDQVKQREQERKMRLEAMQRKEEELKQERQRASEMVYKQWLKSSVSKPKPVPLNQGTDSLRGTINKMYVNPIPWKSNID